MHSLVWGILGAAFLVVGVPQVWDALRQTSFGPMLPYHTTNIYMTGLLQVPNGSERLRQALAALPPQQAIAVILPEGSEEGVFLQYVVSYFAWPRDVLAVPVTRTNAVAQLRAIDRNSVAAIFFCDIDPPPGLQPVFRLGAHLVLAPTAETPEPAAP